MNTMNASKRYAIGFFAGVLTALFACNIARAEDPDAGELARQLTQVLGLDAMLDGIKQHSRQTAQTDAEGAIAEIRSSFPDLADDTLAEMNKAGQAYVNKVNEGWNNVEASQIFAQTLKEGLPASALQAAIDHYNTPEGQREIKVILEANEKLNQYLRVSIQNQSQKAMLELTLELRKIAQRPKPVQPKPKRFWE